MLGFDNYRQQSVDFCLLAADQAAPTLPKKTVTGHPSRDRHRTMSTIESDRGRYRAHSDMRRSYAAASLCLCIGLQLASSLIILCAPRVREPVGVIERG